MKWIRDFNGHQGSVYSLSPTRKPLHFLSGGSDGKIVQWPVNSNADGSAIAIVDDVIFCMYYDVEMCIRDRYNRVSPLLNEEERIWLQKKCQSIQ